MQLGIFNGYISKHALNAIDMNTVYGYRHIRY